MPIAGIAQAVLGGLQAVLGGQKAHRSQRELEAMVNNYKPNEGILDYYNKALARYNTNPYNSAMYNQQTQQAQRGLTTGINALQDRKSALAGVGNLVQGYNDANLKAAAGAEQEQAQALGQLGQATGMKAAEDKYKFENKYNLLAMKAGGANQTANAGISNLYGGISALGDERNIRKYGASSDGTGGY